MTDVMQAMAFAMGHLNQLMTLMSFVGALTTAVQAFRNGAKDRALELAKQATAKVAVDLVGAEDDVKLDAAVDLVYNGLETLLRQETRIGPAAKAVITTLVPRSLVRDAVKRAWHFYVKPAAGTPTA